MDIFDRFLRFLLCFCHCLIASWFYLAGIVRRLKVEVRDLKHSSLANELTKSKLTISEFQKTPEHLGVVLNEESISFSDIAHIIVWCLALGVPYISIYDLRGFVKSNRSKLYKQVATVKEKLLKTNAQKYKISLYSSSVKDDFQNGVQNGHKYEGEVHVSLLSREDGQDDIVKAARTICEDVKNQRLKPTDVVPLHVSKKLHSLPGFPDPDIVVCFGGGQSLVGYLPWHVRLSEIMLVSTHHNFHLKEFMNVLKLFNHCEQRFGI